MRQEVGWDEDDEVVAVGDRGGDWWVEIGVWLEGSEFKRPLGVLSV